MLRKLKHHGFLLFAGALLFAFSGVLHPLFHMDPGGSGTSCADNGGDKAPDHAAPTCPVCAGTFSAVELPEIPELPILPVVPVDFFSVCAIPHQSECVFFRPGRSPPRFS